MIEKKLHFHLINIQMSITLKYIKKYKFHNFFLCEFINNNDNNQFV